MQIRSRLTIQFFLITAALLLASFFAIYFFSAQIQKSEFNELLETRASTTADLLIRVEQVDSSLLKLIDLNKKDVLEYENISVYNAKHKEIYTNNDTIHFSKILPDLESFLDEVTKQGKANISMDSIDVVGLKYINKKTEFVVVACAIDAHRISYLQNLRRVLTLVFIFILAIIGLAGWFFSGRALKPISNVINQVDQISATNLQQRIDEGNKKDEIAKLTIRFNYLLDRIEKAFVSQKTFVSNASHELRNPLTVITSQLEVTLLSQRSAEEYEKVLVSVLEDMKRLNDISHRLLMLTRIDSAAHFEKESIRIDDLLWETKNEFLSSHSGYFVELTFGQLPANEKELIVQGNIGLLKTCFINLMENGCKFSEDQTVRIDLIAHPRKIDILFSDKGMGIADDDHEYIFQPFYRGKNAIALHGYGIGLSMVEKIVKAHHGTISVKSALNKGTSFTTEFPLK